MRKWIAFSVLLAGIFCTSGCGAATTETGVAETEENAGTFDSTGMEDSKEKLLEESPEAENLGEDSKEENGTEERNPEEETGEGNGSEDEMKEEYSMGVASKGHEEALSGNGETLQGRKQAAGRLSVEGTKLVDADGNPVQLRGISTHGLAWYPAYVNEACFHQLKEEWGANVIRLAMYTGENGGYCTGGDREELKSLVKTGVEYGTNNDMYVIIDWHILSDGNPNQYLEESLAFFREMSEAYANYTNVLYEICNEPNGNVSWEEIKGYAEQVIEVIRGNDKEGVILVGTPNWSQYVDQAAADPIRGYDNIMYTLHFYAATHMDALRDTMVKAVEAGLPIFVSEYGICDASGNGAINVEQADKWIALMDSYDISYVAWNLSNKAETSAILKSSCDKISGFATEDLSDSGKWLYEMLRKKDDSVSVKGAFVGEQGNGTGGAGEKGAKAGEGEMSTEEASGGGQKAGTAGDDGQTSGGMAGTRGDMPEGPGGTIEASAESRQPYGETSGSGQISDGLEVTATVINSWEQENKTYYQYTLTIINLTEEDIKGWTVRLKFSGDYTLQDSWNGSYQAEQNALTISSLEYNGDIGKGKSVENIGFIVQGEAGLTVVR